MEKAAKALNFIEAAHFRDQLIELEKLKEKPWKVPYPSPFLDA